MDYFFRYNTSIIEKVAFLRCIKNHFYEVSSYDLAKTPLRYIVSKTRSIESEYKEYEESL